MILPRNFGLKKISTCVGDRVWGCISCVHDSKNFLVAFTKPLLAIKYYFNFRTIFYNYFCEGSGLLWMVPVQKKLLEISKKQKFT